MEAMCHGDSVFVTLTYNEEKVPVNSDGAQILERPDLQKFLKRLRKRLGDGRIRYFGCGEYGDLTWRPHYHLNLFGLSIYHTKDIEAAWGMGHVQVFPFAPGTAQYVAEYTVKKMTRNGDWRLDGRPPEFACMSTKPGIGKPFVEIVANSLYLKYGWDITKEKDVPKNINISGKSVILGRYLRNILRDEVGMTDEWKEAIRQEWVTEVDQEMFPLRINAKDTKASAQQLLVEKNMGRIWSIEAKSKIKPTSKRGKI